MNVGAPGGDVSRPTWVRHSEGDQGVSLLCKIWGTAILREAIADVAWIIWVELGCPSS